MACLFYFHLEAAFQDGASSSDQMCYCKETMTTIKDSRLAASISSRVVTDRIEALTVPLLDLSA